MVSINHSGYYNGYFIAMESIMPGITRQSGSNRSCVLMLTSDQQIDRRTLQQADSLEKAGWLVTILAMPQDGVLHEDDPRVVRIRRKGKASGLLAFYRKIRRHLTINTRIMQALRNLAWTFLGNPETIYCQFFADELEQYTATVVLAIDLPMLPVAAMHARRCGAKLIYDSHELYSEQDFSDRERSQWKNIEEKFIHQCDAVITINPSIASELQARYELNLVHVIYNAIPVDAEPEKNRLFHKLFGLPAERIILLFQGSLSKDRHLKTLVQAMKYLKNPLIDLVILGDGQLKNTLTRLVRLQGIKNRVYFHPAVPQKQLLEYTQAADGGVIPYQAICLNHYFCTPNKLFEFIAAGLPILGSDLPELNQIVLKHRIGLTGSMSSAAELAQLIDKFFHDEKQLAIWRKNNIIARHQFSWRNEEQKLLQIFEDIVA